MTRAGGRPHDLDRLHVGLGVRREGAVLPHLARVDVRDVPPAARVGPSAPGGTLSATANCTRKPRQSMAVKKILQKKKKKKPALSSSPSDLAGKF